jgi:hypothetical protein
MNPQSYSATFAREPSIQGVCKDCGNGTLNNNLNPAFNLDTDDDCDGFPVPSCNACGSTHLDLL